MPPEKRYSAAEVMNMNRRDRRRLGKINGLKIPSVVNVPIIKKERPDKENKVINKILDENRNIQNKIQPSSKNI